MTFEPLRYLGSLEFLLMILAVVTTVILLVSRIRRCRRGLGACDLRDVLMLFAGPVISVLLFLSKAGVAAASYGKLDLDSDAPLRIGMQAASAGISVGVCCFAVGMIGILWPVSRHASA